jgi:16S rRNA (guanine966-N2)-methyltransferase
MRIISGTLGGRNIPIGHGLPVRPTTDYARSGLFNILHNYFQFDETSVLDLFTGTGAISYEFASRGCSDITAVDSNAKCVRFVSENSKTYKVNIRPLKSDVIQFVERCVQKFNIIVADPPYDWKYYAQLHQLVFEKDLLLPGGWFIMEHDEKQDYSSLKNFREVRKYGSSAFSIFTNETGNKD